MLAFDWAIEKVTAFPFCRLHYFFSGCFNFAFLVWGIFGIGILCVLSAADFLAFVPFFFFLLFCFLIPQSFSLRSFLLESFYLSVGFLVYFTFFGSFTTLYLLIDALYSSIKCIELALFDLAQALFSLRNIHWVFFPHCHIHEKVSVYFMVQC